ncbi:MAG TPA: prephenate dehydratase [Actinomycetes bacterium]|nr:prephenate dehydratase [Actinomycetes bacterium]
MTLPGAKTRYAYFGPEGTFSEAALRTLPDVVDPQPFPSVPAALDAVRRREADAAMVPLENSVEGAIGVTLDELALGEPLVITGEVLLPVSFAVMARSGTALDDVRTIATHPHAAAQVRRWVAAKMPQAEIVAEASTAAAAASVAEGQYDAAIAAALAADHYDLEILVDGIHDNDDAVTRFVLVSRTVSPPTATGGDRTSLAAFIADDHPGALLEILTQFSVRGINLTRIESRPTGERLGRYYFSIDCEGHVDDERVGEALTGLRRVCADVRFLGSYRRADLAPGDVAEVPAAISDDEFRDAEAWLARVRDGRSV